MAEVADLVFFHCATIDFFLHIRRGSIENSALLNFLLQTSFQFHITMYVRLEFLTFVQNY